MKAILKYSVIVLALCFYVLGVNGQSTGSIKGKVVDATTKEPLIGATVMVVGTYLGAATDFDGNFTIENVKPNDYTIKVAYIGYSDKMYNGIRIKAGETKTMNMDLTEQSQTLETVTIVGQQNIIDLQSGKSEINISAEDIKEMNSTNVQDIVSMQAGVSKSPDGLQIRGGRVYETQYMVDGVSASDPLAGTGFGVEVGSSSVKSLSVVTGGADVEYGDGTSGVVVTQIKEGGEKVQVAGSYQRDNFGSNTLRGTSFNTDIFDLSVGGSIPGTKKKLGFFASFGGRLTDDYLIADIDRRFPEEKIADVQLRSSLLNNGGEQWAPRFDNKWTNTLKLSYKLGKASKITLTNANSLLINQNTRTLQIVGSDEIMQPGLQWGFARQLESASTYSHRTNLTALNFKQNFGGNWGLDVTFGRLFSKLRADANGEPFRDSTVDKVYDAYSVVTYPVELYFPQNPNQIMVLPGEGFINNGGRTSLWHDHWIEEYTLKYKFTKYTKSKIHVFTFGQEHKEQELYWVDVTKPWVGAPVKLADGTFSPSTRIGTENEIWTVKPATGGFFLQDEIAYKGIIASLGLRYNYWAPGKFADDAVNNPQTPLTDFLRQDYLDNSSNIAGRRFKSRLLPRVRVSFPVTENNVLYFSYGHNMRLPHPRFVYSGLDPVYLNNAFLSRIGNPNLNPEVSVNYEVGIKSQVTRDFGVTFTGFYNDKFDYIVNGVTQIEDQTGATRTRSFSFNQDYARIYGVELGFNYRLNKNIRANLNAGYQVATGKSNSANEALLRIVTDPNINATEEQYLAWDRPFDLKGMLIFTPDTSINFLGGALKGVRVFLTTTWKSGLRYTPAVSSGQTVLGTDRPIYEEDPSQRNEKIGSAWFYTDLKITRDFKITKSSFMSISIEVRNLFNNKNAQIINPVTGRAYENGDALPITARDPNYPNPRESGLPSDNPARYLQPTQILYGISFSF